MQNFRDIVNKQSILPDKWIEDGVEPPTDDCKALTAVVCQCLQESYHVEPYVVAPTVEGGMYIEHTYVGEDFERSMSLEVYNNLDIAVTISDLLGKEILYSTDTTGSSWCCEIRESVRVLEDGIVVPKRTDTDV